MMNGGVGARLGLLAAAGVGVIGVGAIGFAEPAAAVRFDQRDVDQSQLIAIAAPVGGTAHQLLIVEQLNNRRECWNETGNSPTVVEPLLVNFDFTGICSRSPDSNGYSLRVGNEDLGLQYSLRVMRQGDDLVLMATPNRDRTPPLELGRTHGYTNGFARIELNSGWRMTKRVYNGQTLPHVYLTHNQDLPTLIAAATNGGSTGVTIPVSRPPMPSPVTTPIATRPTPTLPERLPSQLPTVPVSSTPVQDNSPNGVIARPTLPTTPTRPTNRPLPTPAQTPSVSYRVVVEAETPELQAQVRAIAPGAFRTLVNGQAMMQAGLFRNRDTADELDRRLQAANLRAMVIPVAGWTPPAQPLPPIANPGTPPSSTPIARRVVVIDPGHGGSDPGAIGIGGIQEKEVVLAIAREVSSLLERQGIQAVMTRQDDRTLELEPRVNFADRVNADLFVSIHANSAGSNSGANGAETYYYGSSAGQQLAQSIQSNLIQTTGMRDRGVKEARFYVLTQTSMPAALVEVGFITGQQDVRRLGSPSSRSQIAGAITDGILQYIQNTQRRN